MNPKLTYLLNRLGERSTWQGVFLVLGALGLKVAPDHAEAVVTAAVALIGLVHVLFPQSGVLQPKDAPSPQSEGPVIPAQNPTP